MSRTFLEITNEYPGYDDLAEPQKYVPLSLRDKLSIFRIIGICCSIIAYQIGYSVKITLQVPIMKKIGLQEWQIALITITDPLSRLLVQPFVEQISDNCKLKFGRRRPFILAGGIGVFFSFLSFFIINFSKSTLKGLLIFTITITLLILNCSLQLLQYPSHSIITDLVPQKQQAIASLISTIIQNSTAFLVNLIDFFLYKFQRELVFLYLIVLVAFFTTVTLVCGREEQLIVAKENVALNPLSAVFSTIKSMPNPILVVAVIYALCWAAFYPFALECTDFFGGDVYGGLDGYHNGVSFGILTFSILSFFTLIYSPFHEKVVHKFGLRVVLAVAMITVALSFILVWMPIPKFARLAVLSPIGICEVIFNSIPFAIVSLSVPVEHLGIYKGVLNAFAAAAQIASSFLIFTLIGQLCSHKVVIIGIGFVAAMAAAFASKYIVLPRGDSTIMEPLAPSADYYNFD